MRSPPGRNKLEAEAGFKPRKVLFKITVFDIGGNRQKMTDMGSKRATTKCTATALVCQP